jgi:hypothetical protein
MDIMRADRLTGEAQAAVDDMFEYHKWDEQQVSRGAQLREALARAVSLIIANVPPCPDRSAAIRKIREARMDCNSAITHRGKY